MAGDSEGVGDQTDHVQRQHEHEDREYEWKKPHTLGACSAAHGRGHELVDNFGGGLQTGGNKATACCGATQKDGDAHDCCQHVGGRVVEHDAGVADLCDGKQIDDLELMDGIDGHGC